MGFKKGNTSTGNIDTDHSKTEDNFCEETPTRRRIDAVQFDEIQTEGIALKLLAQHL